VFRLVTLEDTIRIPPEKFGQPIKAVGLEQLRMKYEGIMDEELGYIVAVVDLDVNPIGKIISGDGATYHKVKFTLLTFYPKIQEIVEGEIVEIADFGAFVRIGPIDALLHVSQLMDDFITGKVGVTARQPFLGKLEWIKEEVKKAHGIAEEKKEETSE